MIEKTTLHASHVALGAKMVDFHGWEMPLHYGSQINEHHTVRQDAGMFDVSHMTIVDVSGNDAALFLGKLLTNDVACLKTYGKALYSCMCNDQGGIIDDLIVYLQSANNYRIILNSATRLHDLAWINKQANNFKVELRERHDYAMLAIQGPNAIEKTLNVLTTEQRTKASKLASFESVEAEDYFFARTGYTGEDGFEIILPKEKIVNFWSRLLENGINPCGLAARDTLRLEAGLLLYGQDMDESTTPLESGLEWTIKWQPLARDFIGMQALLLQKQHGIKRKLVGLILQDKGIMRSGQKILIDGMEAGVITSGTYSPTLAKSIALARVEIKNHDNVYVDIRDKHVKALVGKARFVKQGQVL